MNNLQPPHDPSAPWANRYNEDRGPQSMIQTRQSCAELNLPLSPRSPGGSVHSANVNGYYLDRGNGQYTRLLPADKLPPMNDVSPRETRHDNMVILPPLTANPDQGRDYGHGAQHAEPETQPSAASRQKIFCDKWIHEGVCAFTQRGCRFKHEMPSDTATQWSLGLFHGYPLWWRRRPDLWRSERTSGSPCRRGMAGGNLYGAFNNGQVRRPEGRQGGELGSAVSGRGSGGQRQKHGTGSEMGGQRDLVPFARSCSRARRQVSSEKIGEGAANALAEGKLKSSVW